MFMLVLFSSVVPLRFSTIRLALFGEYDLFGVSIVVNLGKDTPYFHIIQCLIYSLGTCAAQ